jgi:glycosyltransferase involved in cell wall biosynthesis
VRALRAAFALRQIVQRFSIAVVVTSNVGLDSIAWMAKLIGAGFTHVVAHHEYYGKGMLSPINALLWRLAVANASAAYAITSYVRRRNAEYLKLGTLHTTTVLNSIEEKESEPGTAPQALRNELGLNPSGKVLVFVGRLVVNKGCDLLVETLAPHLSRWDATLLMVGAHYDDPENRRYYQALRELISGGENSERIKLLGYRSDVNQIMSGADILVHYARHEGFGLVLAEALTLGIPVVATDVGGIAELLQGTPFRPVALNRPDHFVQQVENWISTGASQLSQLQKMSAVAKDRFSEERRIREVATVIGYGVRRSKGVTL